MIKLVIEGRPITKKNSQRILKNFKTGRRFIAPSENFVNYQESSLYKLNGQYFGETVEIPVNVKCLYYMPTKGQVDLSNLIESTHDILVKAQILKDDNSKIIVSVDGSRVLYDKKNPRVEIVISEVS
ncbi:RusA family crossover junction endodeoxyribonuclease [Clostridium estertheticum]|uniref:RusA family crossover junction endodeoxyribonuclease n=1 Tax=Clostridium estertheticum TaxID=238834 RepID=UPI001C7C9FEA|nr:hypothetical protein [Clostridium estertheticum]MBX4266571.1 hypothetical protein [Clostridium estertheticum]WLC88089.1 hypothetical protein KTC95_19040 [Clostridium estertheticum]